LAARGVQIVLLCTKCGKTLSEGNRFYRLRRRPAPIATGPGVGPARPVAQQTSGKAIASLRHLSLAEIRNRGQGLSRYTCSLSDLSDQIGPELLAGRHAGSVFPWTGCAPDSPGGANLEYPVFAYPQTFYPTGVRAFCRDRSAGLKLEARGSEPGSFERGEIVE
jgi:hypothetical protein